MGYWVWRSIKTAFISLVYYCILLSTSLLFYPMDSFKTVEDWERLIIGMQEIIPIAFVIASVLVIAYKVYKKKEWQSCRSLAFSYFIFFCVHMAFLVPFLQLTNYKIDSLFYIIIGGISEVVAFILGYNLFEEKSKEEIEDDYLYG